MGRLENKVSVVTGGGSGIGRGIATLFAKEGSAVVVAAVALVLHASKPPKHIYCEINDRGIMVDNVLYPFLSLESFWIPHDEVPPKIILKSHKTFMPFIVIFIEEVDPESVREIMLKYIAETEHHEPFLKHLLEGFGF